MKLTIRISDDTWLGLRALSYITGQSMNSLVAASLDAAVAHMKKKVGQDEFNRVANHLRDVNLNQN